MIASVLVTLRTQDNTATPHQVAGTAPHVDSPLAVVPVHIWDKATDTWCRADGYCVTHRPTGMRLPLDFATLELAMAALGRAMPGFPGWLMATGGPGCAATGACKAMWRVARAGA